MATAGPNTSSEARRRPADGLFQPFSLNSLTLANRIVMAPMTRGFSPGGLPGPDVAAYYRRRAAGGVGLIITEGAYIAHASAGPITTIPRLAPGESQAAWRRVVDEVHGAGGRIFPQLWHVGTNGRREGPNIDPDVRLIGPSGLLLDGTEDGPPMTIDEIESVIGAYGVSARLAQKTGFDGIEIHAAHGYLIDQFFWNRTNHRSDRFGGDLVARTRFAAEVVRECRRAVDPDYPICLRFSQWKLLNYDAGLVETPDELERFLAPLIEAGVDIFHCSSRRYWEPAFEGSDLNLAGWTKKLTGLPTVTVGSINCNTAFTDQDSPAVVDNLARLWEMLDRGDFDLVAVGRALIANPAWPQLIRSGRNAELVPFDKATAAEVLY